MKIAYLIILLFGMVIAFALIPHNQNLLPTNTITSPPPETTITPDQLPSISETSYPLVHYIYDELNQEITYGGMELQMDSRNKWATWEIWQQPDNEKTVSLSFKPEVMKAGRWEPLSVTPTVKVQETKNNNLNDSLEVIYKLAAESVNTTVVFKVGSTKVLDLGVQVTAKTAGEFRLVINLDSFPDKKNNLIWKWDQNKTPLNLAEQQVVLLAKNYRAEERGVTALTITPAK